MNLVKAIVFLRKVVGKDVLATDTPLIENSFFDQVRKFENLPLKDLTELVDLANSAHYEELFGLKLYAKLMDL